MERKESGIENLSWRPVDVQATKGQGGEGKGKDRRELTFKATRYGDRRMRFISSDNCLIWVISSIMFEFAPQF